MWSVLLDRCGIVAVRSEWSGLIIVGCWRLLAIVVGPGCRTIEFAWCDGPTGRCRPLSSKPGSKP